MLRASINLDPQRVLKQNLPMRTNNSRSASINLDPQRVLKREEQREHDRHGPRASINLDPQRVLKPS